MRATIKIDDALYDQALRLSDPGVGKPELIRQCMLSELGPSYGLEVESIEFRPGAKGCVLFKLKERVKVQTARGTEMQSVPREVCLSESRLFK